MNNGVTQRCSSVKMKKNAKIHQRAQDRGSSHQHQGHDVTALKLFEVVDKKVLPETMQNEIWIRNASDRHQTAT